MVTPKKQSPQFAFGSKGRQTLSSTSDSASLEPVLAVIFKGLQKRDATTKGRASDELIEYLQSPDYAEDDDSQEALIKAWMALYPTLAIDTDRKVRANAHFILGFLVVKFKRKTATFLQDVGASWLMGLYDGDRTVSRAAQNALESSFVSVEKRLEFKKVFRAAILAKCQELAFGQTSASLSDARFTNESESDAKFSNVTSAALQVLASMSVDRSKSDNRFDNVFEEKRLWELLEGEDATIQRAALIFLQSVLDARSVSQSHSSLIKHMPSVISKCHSVNLLELIQCLQLLAELQPDMVFKCEDSGPKTLPARLIKLIKKSGGAGTPVVYWVTMRDLLLKAAGVSDPTDEVLVPLLSAFGAGAEKAIKTQAELAVTAYCDACVAFIRIGSPGAKDELNAHFNKDLQNLVELDAYSVTLIPLLESHPKTLMSLLLVLAQKAQKLVASSNDGDHPQLEQWLVLNRNLSHDRQDSKFYLLEPVHDIVKNTIASKNLSRAAFAFVCSAFAILGHDSLLQDVEVVEMLKQRLATIDIANLQSPHKAVQLIISLYTVPSSGADMEGLLRSLLGQNDSHNENGAIFVRHLLQEEIRSTAIDDWITTDLLRAESVNSSRWSTYSRYVTSGATSGSVILDVLDAVVRFSPERIEDFLNLLIVICASPNDLLGQISEGDLTTLFDKLWSSCTKRSSGDFSRLLLACMKSGTDTLVSCANRSVLQQVLQTDQESIPIEDLCQITTIITDQAKFSFKAVLDSLPVLLKSVLPENLPKELYVLHPVGSLVFAERSDTGPDSSTYTRYDTQGRSGFLRTSMFLSQSSSSDMNVHMHILLASELLSAKSLDPASNSITRDAPIDEPSAAIEQELLNRSGSEDILIAHIRATHKDDSRGFLWPFGAASDQSSAQYYEALVLYRLLCKAREQGLDVEVANDMFLNTLDNLFLGVACSSAFCESLLLSSKATFQRNKWASELSVGTSPEKALLILPRLLSLLPTDQVASPLMPRPRMVYLIKHVLELAKDNLLNEALVCQTFTLLHRLLYKIKDEYGSFWDNILSLIQEVLCRDSISGPSVPVLYSTLKLLSWLESNSDGNDDLSEFWHNRLKETQRHIAESFIYAAELHEDNQAVTLCTLIAARMMRSVPITVIKDSSRLRMPVLVATGAEHVQLSAFAVQQKLVDDERDEMILTCGLTKEYEEVSAELPAELLSIVLEFPLDDENDLYDMPLLLPTVQRGYCMAWLLIFRYFSGSSLRMRVKLIEDLHMLGLTESLLAFIFLILRLQDDKPADLSKVKRDTLDTGFSDGQGELIAYASHLYFLALTHIPVLVRQWWLDCQDRSLTAAVENLTVKYYSAALIQNDVQSLQSDQSKSLLQDDKLSVKINNAGRDILTTYEIDDQKMEMAIRLPANYPLRRVAVEGLQRVGVKDAQWRAWLLGSQAVLTAQNGSVVDAISLFQRNVSLHFEGVADCNICFSILSVQDKSLPSKKCQTCKNLFHSSCLFKWFKSSSASRCPLCRTSFAF